MGMFMTYILICEIVQREKSMRKLKGWHEAQRKLGDVIYERFVVEYFKIDKKTPHENW